MKKTLSPAYISGFCYELSLILKAGIPLAEGVSLIAENERDKRVKAALTGVCGQLELGERFSDAAAAAGMPALADDSGLCVDALGGAPGVYTARFGGEIPQAAKNALLLEKLAETADPDRTARFVSAVCLALPDGACIEAEGVCEGSILLAPRGGNGFGYDPIFADALGRSFGELPPEEKNRISHRAAALAELAKKLSVSPL